MNINNLIKSSIIVILTIIANIVTIIVFSIIFDTFQLGNWYNAVIITIGVIIANTILWPVLRRLLMKFIVLTFGIGALIINSLIFYGVCCLIPGVSLQATDAFLIPLLMAVASTLISNIADIDYYDLYTNRVAGYVSREKKAYGFPGLIMLEIDGLSIDILKEAIDRNMMPTLKKWIDENSHTLKEWETDLSSQTGASQAGILHGNNEDIVAYRWVEKENNNQIMISGKLAHAPIIEERISNGNGLLCDKGTSITNMFTGDSDNPILTSSRFKLLANSYNKSLNVVFLETYSFQRIIILFLWEIFVEVKSQIMHKIKDIRPRLRRNIIYATIRAGANVLLREVATETLIADMLKGEINSAYASYVGYDEVAHHSGINDDDVWNVLKQIDLQFKRLEKAEKSCDRNYEFVVLSDHGQGNGETFKQRYGITLANYVRRLLPEDMKIYDKNPFISDHFRDAFIPENKQIGTIMDKVDDIKDKDFFSDTIENIKEKTPDFINIEEIKSKYQNNLDYIKTHESKEQSTKKAKNSELIVLGSGNLGLIYLTQWSKRLNYEEIVMLFPNLIPGLVKHSGIGFILVDSFTNGPMVIGAEGIYYLNTDRIEGKNPLEDFGKNAAMHLKRHNKFKHMPDILVNSFYDPETEEICAFEELIGSHGGLGGSQTRPFILYPSDWNDPGELIGAKSIYDFLKKEIEELKDS
ncbi:MAG: alkaline phosphatase family protein [Methanobrevibacter sp.]|uniref:phage holin family protein n=1 Tax=Methanobrevibacter sp. TaxID=66852 RepID=UPI001B0A5C90|nr:phage holin family protein [Methanobrevibacter sp.]MBO5151842.1 alkaline phosphatase family protein [Methanobrevibacter sp.]MBO6110513.1 alkaline phosphatase family protein [Methanobrevibacter sp.]